MERSSMFARLRDDWLMIDPRSLGLFRATIGLVLLLHFVGRWSESADFYGPSGVLPSHLAAASREIPPFPTILTRLERLPFGMTFYFSVAIGAFAALTLGLFARWSALLSLIAFSSLAHRNPYVLIGGDYVLGSMLLWMQVLPIADRFSLDALLRRRANLPLLDNPSNSSPRPSIAAFGVLLQLGLIYLASAWQKSGSTWWQDGTALSHVLGMQRYLHPGAELFSRLPEFWLALLTRAVLVFEYVVLPLILLPLAQPWPRRVALLGLAALHLGIASVLNAGVFSITMLACLPLLLSRQDWEWACRLAGRATKTATLEAVSKAQERGGWSWCVFVKPRISNSGASLWSSPGHPKATTPFRFQMSRLAVTELVSLWLLTGMVLANFNINFHSANRDVSLGPLDLPWRFAAAYQRWDMFAPDAPKSDPQLVTRVRLLDGRLLTVSGNDESSGLNKELASSIDSFAWRVYLLHAILQSNPRRQAEVAPLRTELCQFLAQRLAAAGHSTDGIFTIELWARSVPTRPLPGMPSSAAEPYQISSLDLAAERRERLVRR